MGDSGAEVRIFVSYVHEDDDERRALTNHLKDIPNATVWDDRAIPPGSEWDDDIKRELNSADIILFLVSTDFFKSEFVKKTEIKRALERHDSGEAVVIPVLLKICIWQPRLGRLQALPSDENLPEDKNWVTSDAWDGPNEAYAHVARGVMREVERLMEKRGQQRQRQREAEETYRKKVAKMLADQVISDIEQDTLDELREKLELSQEDADRIEKGELRPIEEQQENLGYYEKTLRREILKGYPFSDEVEADLQKRRDDLLLNDGDVAALQQQIIGEWQTGETERLETERKAKEEADREAKEAADQKAKEEADRKAKEEAAQAEADREAMEVADRKAKVEADRKAKEEAAQAEADAWHLSLAGFLVEQLEDEEGVFRLKPDIPEEVLRAASASYEVPNDETLVGMFAEVADQPELFGILFGRRGIYFTNESFASSPGAHALLYPSFSGRDFSPDIEWLRIGDDLLLPTFSSATLAPLFRRLGDLFEHEQAELEARDELLTADEVVEFAQRVYDGWKSDQEAQAQADGAWSDELVGFLRNHDVPGRLFVAPDIPERKTSHAWERYGIPPDESILGLIDETGMGSAKNGLAFGVRGVYFHNGGGSDSTGSHSVPYSAFPGRKVESTSKYEVSLGDEVSYNSLSAGKVVEVFVDLQALIQDRAS